MKLSVSNDIVLFVACNSLKTNIISYSSALCTLRLELIVVLMQNAYLSQCENN